MGEIVEKSEQSKRIYVKTEETGQVEIERIEDIFTQISKKPEDYGLFEQLFKTEFNILLDVSKQELEKETLPEIVEAIIRVRQGRVMINPGYDGVYGEVGIFSKKERNKFAAQKVLF